MKRRFIAGILILCASSTFAQHVPKEAVTGYKSISSDDLKQYEAVLTADSLEGRETSYPGQKRAARYIAEKFREFGVKPVNSDGTYFQRYDVKLTKIDPATNLTITSPAGIRTQRWGDEFATSIGRDTVVQGNVLFAGYADTEIGSEQNARGRIVMMLAGKRNPGPDTSRAQRLRRLFIPRNDAGAVAYLVVTEDSGAASFQSAMSIRRSFAIVRGTMRLAGQEPRSSRTPPPMVAFITPALADDIARRGGSTLATLRTLAAGADSIAPVLMNDVTVRLDSRMIREDRSSENVVGMIEGSDPVLKNEYVVLSAHYDHLGIDEQGRVFRGADDDGSGTAAVLELARAFAHNSRTPQRSLLFLAVTGEEKGLLGSQFYTTHPLVPLEKTITDLNIDMIGRVDTAHERIGLSDYVYVIGSDKISTQLDSILRVTNDQTERLALDYKYNDESDPEQFYRRSDHYNFVRQGVPVIFFFTGVHADYHQTTDTPEKLLYDRMTRTTRMIYATAWNLANLHGPLQKKPAQDQIR